MHRNGILTLSVCLLVCISSLAQRARKPGEEFGTGVANGYIDVDIKRNFAGSLEPLSIEVASHGIPMARSFSSPSGSTVIGPLEAGHYTVIVSGPGIRSTMEEVDLNEAMGRHRVIMNVDRDSNQTPAVANGTVSAADLNAPSDAKKHYGKGLKLARERQWEKAIPEFKRATEVFPQYGSAYTALGLAYFEVHDLGKAEEYFNKAVEINTSDGMALRWLGKLRMAERNFAAAEKFLESANRVDPSSDEVLVMLAWSQLETGKTQTAIETALRVNEKSLHASAAHLIAGRAYDLTSRPEAALAQYQLCIKADPKSPNMQFAQGRIAALTAK